MVNELKEIIRKADRKVLRDFGILIGVVLISLTGVIYYYTKQVNILTLIPGLALIIIALLFPISLKPFYAIWMAFAVIMGWIVTRIILILLFYAIITPLAVTLRLLGTKFMNVRMEKEKQSYWELRGEKYQEKPTYLKQF